MEAFDPYWIKVITYANALLFAHKTLEDIKKTSRNKTCKNTQQIIDDMREGQKAMTEFVKGIKKLSSFSNNSVPGKIIRFYLDFFIAADCFFDKIYAYSKRIAQEIKTLEKKGSIKLNRNTVINTEIYRHND